jgi:beta-1,4-mannosyltransferase
VRINLVAPVEGDADGGRDVLIPHGDYRSIFGAHERETSIPGRVLYFGMMKPYKGIESLLASFHALEDTGASLRLVGSPSNAGVVRQISDLERQDQRVSARFAFVPDADLVREVTSAGLVVLPYRELHSSGAALVALSLDRPILVPDTATTRALREEAGPEWVRIFSGSLDAEQLADAVVWAASPRETERPNLTARTWEVVRDAHRKAYRRAVGRAE